MTITADAQVGMESIAEADIGVVDVHMDYRLAKASVNHKRLLIIRHAHPVPSPQVKLKSVYHVHALCSLSFALRAASFYDNKGELVHVQWGVDDTVTLVTEPPAKDAEYEVEGR